jgi:DNA-binding transcriptional ArsR family regulator
VGAVIDQSGAVGALSALAQATRLSVFRLLVRAGPTGLNAGDISAALEVQPSTMSHHLGLLERAHLVRSHRDGRTVVYAADYDGMRRLLGFLTEDCCQGRPEICGANITDPLNCSAKETCE